jgi:hypothetical protein
VRKLFFCEQIRHFKSYYIYPRPYCCARRDGLSACDLLPSAKCYMEGRSRPLPLHSFAFYAPLNASIRTPHLTRLFNPLHRGLALAAKMIALSPRQSLSFIEASRAHSSRRLSPFPDRRGIFDIICALGLQPTRGSNARGIRESKLCARPPNARSCAQWLLPRNLPRAKLTRAKTEAAQSCSAPASASAFSSFSLLSLSPLLEREIYRSCQSHASRAAPKRRSCHSQVCIRRNTHFAKFILELIQIFNSCILLLIMLHYIDGSNIIRKHCRS